jgi:hypothetical protein
MAGTRKPLYELTPDDRAPIVIVVGYTLLAISIVIIAVRFLHAAHRRIKFGLDDVTYLIANVRSTPIMADAFFLLTCFHRSSPSAAPLCCIELPIMVWGGTSQHVPIMISTTSLRYDSIVCPSAHLCAYQFLSKDHVFSPLSRDISHVLCKSIRAVPARQNIRSTIHQAHCNILLGCLGNILHHRKSSVQPYAAVDDESVAVSRTRQTNLPRVCIQYSQRCSACILDCTQYLEALNASEEKAPSNICIRNTSFVSCPHYAHSICHLIELNTDCRSVCVPIIAQLVFLHQYLGSTDPTCK